MKLRKEGTGAVERNLTTGSVFKNVVLFSLPYLLSYFLQTLYGMAGLFIIGPFDGVASTTAVSIGPQVMHMLTVMIVGLAMGTTVSIGQAVGAGGRFALLSERAKHAWRIFCTTVTWTKCQTSWGGRRPSSRKSGRSSPTSSERSSPRCTTRAAAYRSFQVCAMVSSFSQ